MFKKVKCLTLAEKSRLLDDLAAGARVTDLAAKYGIAKATVCAIRKKKESIVKTVSNTYSGPGKRKTLKKPELPMMEKKLYLWFLEQRNKNCPINGDIMKEKARQLHNELKETDISFNASEGWLQRFKTRYGIRFLKITGEKLSSRPELVEPFKQKLRKKMEDMNISLEQVYNADESGLFWKLLPDKTFVSSFEKTACGRKNEKQRLTFLACTNGTGSHKLKPLVIGHAQNPRAFKNFVCPLIYKNSKRAWMTAAIFKDWFFNNFVPDVKRFQKERNIPMKAILLLDNAPAHPPECELKTEDGSILTLFMPPNVTPLIQPMDQNAIRLTKLFYRKSLLSTILAKGGNIEQILKNLTVKDAVLNLAHAWNQLDTQTIAKCWNPLVRDLEPAVDDEDDLPLNILRDRWLRDDEMQAPVTEAIQLLEALYPAGSFTVDDIEEWNTDVPAEDINEVELCEKNDQEVIIEERRTHINANEAIDIFNKAIDWAESDSASFNDISVLKKLRERAVVKSLQKSQRQTKISSFFV